MAVEPTCVISTELYAVKSSLLAVAFVAGISRPLRKSAVVLSLFLIGKVPPTVLELGSTLCSMRAIYPTYSRCQGLIDIFLRGLELNVICEHLILRIPTEKQAVIIQATAKQRRRQLCSWRNYWCTRNARLGPS